MRGKHREMWQYIARGMIVEQMKRKWVVGHVLYDK